MKRTKRLSWPVIFSLLICLCFQVVYARRVLYSYDSSGNRTQAYKDIIFRSEGEVDDVDSEPRREDLSLHRITIYPNPTKGQLSVEITGEGSLEGASISIYSMNGSVVYSNSEPEGENNINLSESPNGIYLLIIRVDGETSSWKIIKD